MASRGAPVIDMSRLGTSAAERAALDAACRDWGVFQLVGHGLCEARVADLRRSMREFFALPLEQKQEISRTGQNAWGYFDRELTKNTRDWKQIFDYGPTASEGPMEGWQPQWPRSLPAFEKAVVAYYADCERLAFGLLEALALALGASPGDLTRGFRPAHTSFLRLNYYPRCPSPETPETVATPVEGHLALNHHTDSGALTLLLQDEQPGLQVYREGRWCAVDPDPRALTVNIGDIVQVWSNDHYPAPLHRVAASRDAERYSVPFFFNPDYHYSYAPLPAVCDARRPARYRPIRWGEFRARRSAGDYANYGDEVQISDWSL